MTNTRETRSTWSEVAPISWPKSLPATMHPKHKWILTNVDQGEYRLWAVYYLTPPELTQPILKVNYHLGNRSDIVQVDHLLSKLLATIPSKDLPPLKDFLHMAEMLRITGV